MPRLAAIGARVRVLDAFTRTEHAPYRAPHDRRPAAAVRAAEDRVAAALLRVAEVVDLGFEDAPGRLGVRLDQPCDPALPVDDALAAALAAAIAADVAGAHGAALDGRAPKGAPPPGWLLAPLTPPGAHVDHRVLHAAARRVVAGEARVAWYEDLPYATRIDATAVEAAAGALADALGTRLVPIVRTSWDGGRRKRYAVGCYASQTAPADLDVLAQTPDVSGTRRGDAERLWVPVLAADTWARTPGGGAD